VILSDNENKNKYICDSIETVAAAEYRGFLSQVILARLRDFVEHSMLKIFAIDKLRTTDIDNTWENIKKAVEYAKTRGDLKYLRRFHDFLQISASHYTLEQESSERLMLKYYEFLLRMKDYIKVKFSLNVLGNIDKFPLNTDTTLNEYYSKIAEKVDLCRHADPKFGIADAYYVHKVKPFFVNHQIYYEVTFTMASEKASKFDRAIAFTVFDIPQYYAVRLNVIDDNIQILGNTMPIFVILSWETSIRPCEINNFARIFGKNLSMQRHHSEYRNLMQYLTRTGFSLVDIINLPDSYFQSAKSEIVSDAKAARFFDILEECRVIINKNASGCNVLRYLLYCLNNGIIKKQKGYYNRKLSNLRLSYGCIPFDDMPFNSSLIGHNPRLFDLLDCIDAAERRHEIFARLIKNNTEVNGILFTSVKDIIGYDDYTNLISLYNNKLYYKHTRRRLIFDKGHIYIKELKDDTNFIIDRLSDLASRGITNYSNSVTAWMNTTSHVIDCPEKKDALIHMFEHSKVALVYGSAGTGKSTFINHISYFFLTKANCFCQIQIQRLIIFVIEWMFPDVIFPLLPNF